jgi:selenocysteine-specific elongation factor
VTTRNFVIATAGHVDHGKSALVKALTGTDPDRLPEEKARQITIELGFAELNLRGPAGEEIHAAIVDVPGHEDFVRNMIAGVGSIDLALLVVAADDGWMPQTEEHLQILTYLGVDRAVIALTKIDIGDAAKTKAQIRERVREAKFADSPIVAVSVHNDIGLEELKRALASKLSKTQPQRDIGKPRLFVDRAFTLRGIGTVVTGTLTGGPIQRGQNVVIQSRNLSARVRSIQSHGRDSETACPGMRTAINLPDLPVGPDGIERGDVVTIADLGGVTDTFDIVLEKSARLNRNSSAARPLKNGSSAHIHFGTSRVRAKISLLNQDVIEPGQRAIAQLRLDSPLLAFAGDRFVVRDSSEQDTIAGGVVLDVDGNRENFRIPAQAQFLKTRASAVDDVDLCISSQLARDGFAETGGLLIKSHFSADEIADALTRLERNGQIILRGEIAAATPHWRDLIAHATALIDLLHKKHPEQLGLDLTKVRAELNIGSDALFAAIISELTGSGFVRAENYVARSSHRPSLPPEILPAAEEIRAALAKKPFDPPSRKDFSKDRHLQQALRFLIEQGEVVELNSEIVLLRDAAEQMQIDVAEFLSEHASATASQLRQKIGTSRRIIIPFLEYLDRAGVTRRKGNHRTLIRPIGLVSPREPSNS